jgi:nicotinamidase-related amidase
VAQELLSAQTPYLSKEQIVPPVITNYQPSAFGPNTYWTTRGERGSEKIVAHTNAVIDVAVATALPALQSAFNHPPDENRFKKATILDNTLHELGHTLAPNNDTLVRKRVGTSADSKIAEELKADTGNMKILKLTLEKGLAKSVNGSDQLWAKLGDVCDYLKNKSSASGTSGERYYFAGLAMISRLIDNGVLIEKDGKYSISDANAGIAALEKIHDELTEIYLKGNQDELHEYINKIRAKKDDPEILKFITLLQTK